MTRFPPVKPSDLTSDQQAAHDNASKICSKMFGSQFLYKDSNGAFIGPFAPLLYTPSLVDPFFNLVVALGKLPNLPADARETAILATGSVFKAGYELYAHSRVAEKSAGLSKKQVEAVTKGEKPTGEDRLSEKCEVAFDVAKNLASTPGNMGEELWKRTEQAFGREGSAALIQYVGIYAYTCVLLNGVAAPVPE